MIDWCSGAGFYLQNGELTSVRIALSQGQPNARLVTGRSGGELFTVDGTGKLKLSNGHCIRTGPGTHTNHAQITLRQEINNYRVGYFRQKSGLEILQHTH